MTAAQCYQQSPQLAYYHVIYLGAGDSNYAYKLPSIYKYLGGQVQTISDKQAQVATITTQQHLALTPLRALQ